MSLYALHIASGATGAFHDVLSPTFTSFLPGIPLYFSFDLAATRTSGVANATLHLEIRWYDATGTALTPWTNDTIINATIPDTLNKFTVTPPATATSGKCYIKVTPAASPMQHEVWIKKLRLGKTELSATNGADWSANLANRPGNLASISGSEALLNSTNGNELLDDSFDPNYWSLTVGAGQTVARMTRGAINGFSAGYAPWVFNWDIPSNTAAASEINTSMRRFPVEAGKVYNYGIWAQKNGPAPTSASFSYGIRWFDATGTVISTVSTSVNAGNVIASVDPQMFRASTKAPTNAATGIFVLSVSNVFPTAAYTFRFERPFINKMENSGLSYAGSGVLLGDGRNLPSVFSAGGRYYFSQAPTYTAAAGTPPTATISLAAGTLQVGGTPISYNAMSVGVTGTSGVTATYYLYIDDLGFAGGTKTLVATTSNLTTYQSDARIFLGSIDVTFPSSGTTTGTGGSGGGGVGSTGCVEENSWVLTLRGYVQAKNVRVGDWLVVLDYETMETVTADRVTHTELSPQDGWEIRTQDGSAVLHLSSSTPLTLRDGSCIYPCELAGHELPVLINGDFSWKACVAQPLGRPINVALISCHSQTYAAGMAQDRLILTHNIISYK